MKFRNTNETAPATLQLAPMIDVVFLLLIFFLVTWSYARFENELDISVPAADESQDPKRRFGEQIINVTEDGRVVVNTLLPPAPQDGCVQTWRNFPRAFAHFAA